MQSSDSSHPVCRDLERRNNSHPVCRDLERRNNNRNVLHQLQQTSCKHPPHEVTSSVATTLWRILPSSIYSVTRIAQVRRQRTPTYLLKPLHIPDTDAKPLALPAPPHIACETHWTARLVKLANLQMLPPPAVRNKHGNSYMQTEIQLQ